MSIRMDHLDDWLKQSLELRFEDLIVERMSSIPCLDPQTLNLVADEIVKAISQSRAMIELRNSLLQNSFDIVDRSNSPLACGASYSNHCAVQLTRSSTSSRCAGDGSPRNENTDNFSHLPNSGKSIAHQSTKQRMHALEVLLRVPIGDIVYSANWPHLQKELCETLCDEKWTVFIQVLKVLTRLSSALSFNPVREGILSLLEGLTLHYLSRHFHQQLPSILHGIQLDNPVHRRIILISFSLLQVLNELPGRWIRYGEKRVQEIVDNLIDLLSMHTHHQRTFSTNKNRDILYPFHIFSVLDPEAKWCRSVAHAAFGRGILLKCVMKTTNFMRFIVEEIILWLECHMKFSDGATAVYELSHNGSINGNMVSLSVFLQSISLLQLLVNCDRAHLLFPVVTSVQEDSVTIYVILLKILEFLNIIANEPKIIYSSRFLQILENACVSLILSRGTRILYGNSTDLIHLLLEMPKKSDDFHLHSHNIRILCRVSESQPALSWMLGRPARKSREGVFRAFSDLRVSVSSANSSGREGAFTSRSSSVARKIGKAAASALRERNRFTSEAVSPICQLLELCGKLFSTPDGYLLLESYEGQLIPLAGHLLIYVRNLMYTLDQGLLSIQQSLETFLMSMTLTPLGFLAVRSVHGLLNCLVSISVEGPIIPKFHEPKFLLLLQLTSLTQEVNLQQYRKRFIRHAFTQLWSVLDDVSKWRWKEALNLFITRVLSTCASPTVISEMWENQDKEDSSSESTLVEELEPLSLQELFFTTVQYSSDVCHSHIEEVSLSVLHSLVHNIDLAIVLQDKLRLTDCLQRKLADMRLKDISNEQTNQPSPRKAATFLVTDNSALSCHHILTILHQMRDSSAHDFPSCWSPTSPRSLTCMGRSRVQTDLQRFLQDTRNGLHDNTWMSHARRAYRTSCRSELKVSVLLDLLDQVLRSRTSPSPAEASNGWPSVVVYPPHTQQHLLAIQMIIRYGCQSKVLSANMMSQHIDQLSLLLHQAKSFLNLEEGNECFDWFVSSVFLMCAGNVDRSRSILQRVALLSSGPFIWTSLSQNTVHMTSSVSQHLQGLVAEFLPKMYNFLLEAGIPWWLISERLNHQALMPAIPLSQLPHLVALTALHSWEYNMYVHVSMLSHIQSRILDWSIHRPILSIFQELQLHDFSIGDYLPFMDKMAKLNRTHPHADRVATATL